MSGFFGMVRADGQEVSRALLERVAEVMRFRGRDGEGIWTQAGVGIVFSYLKMGPSRQSPQQPVVAGPYLLIGDVRIDARRDLLGALMREGAEVSCESSSEQLLLHAWQLWGNAALERMIGDFSFALWDRVASCFYGVRDFVGARPFYYARTDTLFCFSNTLETLWCVPEISRELDERFIGEFLLYGYCADPTRTAYARIRRLPAGHILRYEKQTVQVKRFLTLPVEEPYRFARPEECLELYREVLREAVRDRLPEGPAALYLSGGLDSGSVSAIAARLAADQNHMNLLKAFTVSWRPLFDDPEPHFASLTAEHLGLEHHIFEEKEYYPFAQGNLQEHRPSPEPDAEAFSARAHGNYLAIARHAPVVLSGDGGDDVLSGQSWPYFKKLWSSGEWQELLKTVGRFLRDHGRLPPLRAGIRVKLREFLGGNREDRRLPEWLNAEFAARNGLGEKGDAAETLVSTHHPIHPQAYAGLHRGYWASVLESEDAGNTGVALETRAPLLDLRVLRFLLRVPPVPWCANKQLTRRAMQGDLPEAILTRLKTPLLRDPLEVCWGNGTWSPETSAKPPAVIHRFIVWEKFVETLKYSKGYSYTRILFPLAFLRWVKDVENDYKIQYSVGEGRE